MERSADYKQRGSPPPAAVLGIESLFHGYPCQLVANDGGGLRGVVAQREIAAGERLLVSAPLGIAIDWRHKATGCAHCFATHECSKDAPGDDHQWVLRCETCRSCYYCSARCQAAGAAQHALECAALKAVENHKRLKNPERVLARLLVTILSSLVVHKQQQQRCDGVSAGGSSAAAAPPPPLLMALPIRSTVVMALPTVACLSTALRHPSLAMLLELFPDQAEMSKGTSKTSPAKRVRQRTAAAKVVLASGSAALLAALPPGTAAGDLALLVAALSRGPMNQFGLWPTMAGEDGTAGCAYFPAAAMLNHSCLPNVVYQLEEKTLAFYAISAIAKGEALCQCYHALGAEGDTMVRRDALALSWCFNCTCVRCHCHGNRPAAVAAAAAFDAEHLCRCGHFKVPRAASRAGAGEIEIETIAAQRGKAQSLPAGKVCCCSVYNMRLNPSGAPAV